MRNAVGFVCWNVGLSVLAVLLAPLSVSAAANDTILFDDFDTVTDYWRYHNKPSDYTYRDGYVFVNISAEMGTGTAAIHLVNPSPLNYPMGFEVKLRHPCIVEGFRHFGFYDGANRLRWIWLCNKSVPERQGLHAVSLINNKYTLFEPIEIDVTEWHTYTIIWEESNGTFLIDGEIVAQTDQVMTTNAELYITVRSLRVYGTVNNYDTASISFETNQSTQIDYVRLFIDAEQFQNWSNEISELFSDAEDAISELENKGIDTIRVREHLYDKAKDSWQKDYYIYFDAKEYLQTIITYLEHFDEITEKFSTCTEIIEKARQDGLADRTIKIMEGYYSQAEKSWRDYDYLNAAINLEKIMDMPERILATLAILGLALTKRYTRF